MCLREMLTPKAYAKRGNHNREKSLRQTLTPSFPPRAYAAAYATTLRKTLLSWTEHLQDAYDATLRNTLTPHGILAWVRRSKPSRIVLVPMRMECWPVYLRHAYAACLRRTLTPHGILAEVRRSKPLRIELAPMRMESWQVYLRHAYATTFTPQAYAAWNPGRGAPLKAFALRAFPYA